MCGTVDYHIIEELQDLMVIVTSSANLIKYLSSFYFPDVTTHKNEQKARVIIRRQKARHLVNIP